MKSKKKAVLIAMCTILLVATSALGTFAYLTDSEAVENTFTVGRVGLKLDEAAVKPDGSYETDHDTRRQKNEYHLLPGHTYCKDPTVTVEANSEAAYIRMIVTVERIDRLKEAFPKSEQLEYYGEEDIFLLQKLCADKDGKCTWDPNEWKIQSYSESADGKTGVYEFRYKEIVQKSAQATVLPDLFTHITVPGEVNSTHLAYLKDVKIVVNAHAMQADGFENDENSAWEAFGKQKP